MLPHVEAGMSFDRERRMNMPSVAQHHLRLTRPLNAYVRSGLRTAGLLATIAVGVGLAPIGTATAAPQGAFKGEAYGTSTTAVVGPIAASLGRTAYLPCPCPGTNGKTLQNTINNLSVGTGGQVLKANAVTSTVLTTKTTSTAKVTNTSTIAGLNLLNGLIRATTVKAVANTTATATTLSSNATGSTFVGLVIGNQAITANPAPGTRITLPGGLGTVILNNVVKVGGSTAKQQTITVEMIRVELATATLGLPAGAKIVVAHAVSGFSRTTLPALLGGQAYAASANATIGSVLQNQIGRQALVTVGCLGTYGVTRTNTVASVKAGNIVSTGTGTTTAFGGLNGTSGTIARTTAKIENASLLNGLITFGAINISAEDKWNGSTHTRTITSQFLNLKVAGLALPVSVGKNTRIDLPLLGYVIINEQKTPATATAKGLTQVIGLRIVVTNTNLLGLKVGSEITVAYASANARL